MQQHTKVSLYVREHGTRRYIKVPKPSKDGPRSDPRASALLPGIAGRVCRTITTLPQARASIPVLHEPISSHRDS